MKNLKNLELLKESLTTSLITSLTSSVITEYNRLLPDNGWIILSQFANLKLNSEQSRALSVNDLERIFRGRIHINTIRSMIKKLMFKSYIKLWRDDWGKTRTEKTYIVTTDGILAWNRYKKEVIDML